MATKDKIVYLYGFSTTMESKLTNLIQIIENHLEQNTHISIVFIHDGVIGTSQKSRKSHALKKLLNLPLVFYTMIPDLKARGIGTQNLQPKFTSINYDELVDILAEAPKIVSWM
ncbi:hypothetical protein LCGC14_0705110 [marine sediment metagenome]|uniref:Sulfurtransferase complex subunit TusB n=1 Tax=marine sediment metagenome TaxID=412755 RepID=A0A0F9QGQ7_9ZZZZ|nr:hypothetical protein [bacterium]